MANTTTRKRAEVRTPSTVDTYSSFLYSQNSVVASNSKDVRKDRDAGCSLKVHKREKFFGSDFEFFTIL